MRKKSTLERNMKEKNMITFRERNFQNTHLKWRKFTKNPDKARSDSRKITKSLRQGSWQMDVYSCQHSMMNYVSKSEIAVSYEKLQIFFYLIKH